MKHPVKKTKLSAKSSDPQQARSLAKGLQILELLAESHQPMSLTEVARAAGLGKVSTLRLLRTLLQTGHLLRDSNDQYRVEGDWPSSHIQSLLRTVREASSPVMESLSARYGESVALAFLYEDHIRVVEVLECTQHIRMSNHVGRILQPYASALGKAITAFQSAARIQTLLDTYGVYPLTARTITGAHGIQTELASVRETGVAWDRGETVEGGQCISAPVRLASHGVVAALSISMPLLRFTPELEKTLPAAVKDAVSSVAKAAEKRLAQETGGSPAEPRKSPRSTRARP
jgi:DNA-binding IclR family transcriptional regulator